MSAPHVFVVRADLMKLACDAWLVPGGNGPGSTWKAALPPRKQQLELPPRWGEDGQRRATLLADVDDATPLPILTSITLTNRAGPEWYVQGARDFLQVATETLRARRRRPLNGRARYLLALPLLGTKGGGGEFYSGEITRLLLPLLREEAGRLAGPGEVGVDVALCLIEGPAWAAAQKMRLEDDDDDFAALPAALREQADSLAEKARSGGLTIFVGAGVSRPAGLPSWHELLHALAVEHLDTASPGHPDPAQLEAFDSLSELDRAALLQRRLPPTESLGTAVSRLLVKSSRHYAIGHALLASLPVDEVVTTNYDDLFETASAAVGRPCARIPGQPVARGERFILKMHGCVSRPSSIVLTREDYLRFQENRSALAGIVQALLLTRHMLFVGFGFTDDNFHRIAHAVRSALRGELDVTPDVAQGLVPGLMSVPANGPASAPEPPSKKPKKKQPFGTNLVVGGGALVADLWNDDLDWIALSEHATSMAEQARLVEIFLDRLSASAATVTMHLGDDRYAGVLSDGEKMLRTRLEALLHDVTPAEQATMAFDEVKALMLRLGLALGAPTSGARRDRGEGR